MPKTAIECTIALPQDLATAHQQIIKLYHDTLFLKEELAQIKRMIFGQKSERFVSTETPAEQMALDLFDDTQQPPVGFVEDTQKISYTRRKRKKGHGRSAIPDDIHTEEILLDVEETEKHCSYCGKEKRCIGCDETTELEYTPAVFYAKKYIRPKYVCTEICDQGVSTALLPSRPIDKGIAGPGLLAYILVSKFVDHLPLYRLETIFSRYGIHINRSTMVGWIAKVCEHLQNVYDALYENVLDSSYIQSDETPLKVQDRNKKKKCHIGYLWPYTDGKQIVFEYCSSRNRDGPVAFLEKFTGYIQTDGYAGYNKIASQGSVIHLMCWAHARRKFYDARNSDSEYTTAILALIAKLYAIEKYCRKQQLDAEQRKAARLEAAPVILENIKKLLSISSMCPLNTVSFSFRQTHTERLCSEM